MRSNPVSSAVLTLALSFGGSPARAATSPFHKIAPAEGAVLELGLNDTIHFSFQIEWNAVQPIPAGKPLDVDIRVYAPCCGALLDVKVPKGSSSAQMSFAQLRAAMLQRKVPASTELMWEFLGAKDSGDARKFRVDVALK